MRTGAPVNAARFTLQCNRGQGRGGCAESLARSCDPQSADDLDDVIQRIAGEISNQRVSK